MQEIVPLEVREGQREGLAGGAKGIRTRSIFLRRKSANFPLNSRPHSPISPTENFLDYSMKIRLSPRWYFLVDSSRICLYLAAEFFVVLMRRSSLDFMARQSGNGLAPKGASP
jgi:hypothetical protein